MTNEEKLCPFMSRVIQDYNDSEVSEDGIQNTINKNGLYEVECRKERCMAWEAVGGTMGNPEYGCRLLQ